MNDYLDPDHWCNGGEHESLLPIEKAFAEMEEKVKAANEEIQRLREQADKLHWALRASEQKLKEAMQLLTTAFIDTKEYKDPFIWLQRRINLEDRYYNHKD